MNQEKKEILQTLFSESEPFAAGVDRVSFRVKQRGRLKALDELIQEGDVRIQRDRYLVDLLALKDVGSPEIEQFLKDCESVFLILRERYIENQRDSIAVKDLAARSTMGEERFRSTLAYLHECLPVLGAINGFKLHEPSSSVVPSETVLGLENFEMVYGMLQHFKDARVTVTAQLSTAGSETEKSPFNRVLQPKAPRATTMSHRFKHLPVGLRGLMQEVVVAHENGLMRLCAMGLRATIDVWCDDVAGRDLASFPAKLKELEARGCVSATQRDHLNAVVQMGHASAHRGFQPSTRDVGECLDLLERVLKSHYKDPQTTKRLASVTPARKRLTSNKAEKGPAEAP